MVDVIFRKKLLINYISDLKNGRTQDKKKKKVIPPVCSSIKSGFQIYYSRVLNCKDFLKLLLFFPNKILT